MRKHLLASHFHCAPFFSSSFPFLFCLFFSFPFSLAILMKLFPFAHQKSLLGVASRNICFHPRGFNFQPIYNLSDPYNLKAMDFISPLIEPILSLVLNPLKRHIRYLVKARTNVQNMTNHLEKLRACQDDIQKEIEDAERQQKQSTEEVNLWLETVSKVEDQVVTIKNKYENRGCRLFGDSSLNCLLAYKYGKRATKLLEEMVQLERERKDFNVIARVQSPGPGHAIPTESTLFGLDRYVEMVRNHLIDDTVGVIGIHGMGGVGKTTLLTKVNNSLLEGERLGFKHLIWVVVSKEFQLENLQAQVAKSLGLKLNDNGDAKEHAGIIFQYLKDKSFLLFLDDVWKWVKLVDVGIPDTRCNTSSNNQTRRMQKVIFTTRLKKVCGEMGASKIIKVECLSKEDAKALFMKTLGEWNLESNLGIHSLVEEVVGECAGLPLALTVIARAMATKTTISEWRVAAEALKKSHAHEILDDDSIKMYHTLKFSYDSLKSDDLRRCFLYCSLWPEDYSIPELDLITFCIGNDLIKDFDSMSEAYDKGHCLIEDLKRACLLEDGSSHSRVKMHDVMRDLALWIASDCGVNQNNWIVKSGIGRRKAPAEVGKWKEAHVICLMFNEIEKLPSLPFECPSLSFLLLQNNRPLRKIHPSFFQNMCTLTYLDLSSTKTNELPESITMLTRLRCLNLEDTSELEYIPSGMISSLQELQVLELYNSGICRFLEDCVGDVENNDDGDGRKASRMSRREKCLLEELECVAKVGLKGLSIDVLSDDAFQRLSMLSHTVSIWRLGLRGLKGVVNTLQLQHNIWRSLQTLFFDYCDDVEVVEFVVDAERKSETSSSPIEVLDIDGLGQLKEILWRGVAPSAGFFHKLRDVYINDCSGLKSISWVLELPSLVGLTLWACCGLEWLIDEEEEQDRTAVAFPTLKILILNDLPKLSHICGPQYGLPALQQLYVTGCPKLRKFPFPSNNNGISSKLKDIKCDRQWWEGLEWDDESSKASMESICTFR